MKKTVLTTLLALLITGCGGGDGEQEETPIRPPVTPNYFEASSQSSAGGQLNPTSLRLAAGEQGRFSVQADSGYLLTEISGCDGTLDGLTYTTGPMRSDCQISASFTQESAAVYFNATTQASQGGALSPDALRLNAGEQGRFTVQPESGFVLAQIAGCEGTLTGNTYTTAPMRADCQVSARFISDAANAIAREDHTLASEQSLIAHARAAIADSEAHRTELVRSLYQGMAQISWNPSHDSITFSSFQPESTVTLLPPTSMAKERARSEVW
ncbi:InlB B-repeat-containing protein [Aeromonas sp. 11P]|uniref:InlB B-repeat-containing protein n=1 Tax=Aeromonas sp. 11P TaxID=3452713 RepID=UPI003F79ECF6